MARVVRAQKAVFAAPDAEPMIITVQEMLGGGPSAMIKRRLDLWRSRFSAQPASPAPPAFALADEQVAEARAALATTQGGIWREALRRRKIRQRACPEDRTIKRLASPA